VLLLVAVVVVAVVPDDWRGEDTTVNHTIGGVSVFNGRVVVFERVVFECCRKFIEVNFGRERRRRFIRYINRISSGIVIDRYV
jgi:hypothetical protein